MQTRPRCGKIETNREWLKCPVCKQKLLKLLPQTQANNLVVYCRKCGQESVVNIPREPEP